MKNKILGGVILAVILTSVCWCTCLGAEPATDNTVDYEEIYMNFAREVDATADEINELRYYTSGLMMMDLNRDNVPELFAYSEQVSHYDENGNPIFAMDENYDNPVNVRQKYWLKQAFSIIDGKVVEHTPWKQETHTTMINLPFLPDKNQNDETEFCKVVQEFYANEIIIARTIYAGGVYNSAVWYDNGEFGYYTSSEDFFANRPLRGVDLPVANKDFSGVGIGRATVLEVMESLLQDYQEKTENANNVSDWAEEAVNEAKKADLIPYEMLYEDYSEPVTREEFAGIAIKLLEKITDREYQIRGGSPFLDVDDSAYYRYIVKAYNASVVTGISQIEFEPYSTLTREQMSTMLCRVIKSASDINYRVENDGEYLLDIYGAVPFSDDDNISDYAKESVYYMGKTGIIKGVGENCFAPQETATKEQAIMLAMRIYSMY